jgi:DNA replication and repair protein RecF
MNGSGKTNFLDAIYCLSNGRSVFHHVDHQLVRFEQPFCWIKGVFQLHDKPDEILFGFHVGKKKVIKKNGAEYDKLSDHFGRYPIIMMNPFDTDLIRGGSEIRRRFIDSLLSQLNPVYLNQLILYNHTLRQRNALLKNSFPWKSSDEALLDTYDEKMAPIADDISQQRSQLINEFDSVAGTIYQDISSNRELLSIAYETTLDNRSAAKAIADSREEDLRSRRSNAGIHKDDYQINLNHRSAKQFGSQGQQKSCTLALKLAQHALISNNTSIQPIVLLDDLFDRLDEERIKQLLLHLLKEDGQQIFISHTSRIQVNDMVQSVGFSAQNLEIERGTIK